MGSSLVRRLIVLCAILAMPAAGYRAGSGVDRHGDRFDGRRAARRHGDGRARGHREHVRGGDRRARDVIGFPPASAPTGSPRSSPGFTTVTRTGVELLVGQTVDVNLQMSPSTVQETVTVTGRIAAARHHARRAWAATSIRGRCRSCRCRAATGWRWRCWRRAAGRNAQGAAAGTGTAATPASSSSTSTASRCRRTSAPAASRGTARTRSPSSSSSRTGSTRRRADRRACR